LRKSKISTANFKIGGSQTPGFSLNASQERLNFPEIDKLNNKYLEKRKKKFCWLTKLGQNLFRKKGF